MKKMLSIALLLWGTFIVLGGVVGFIENLEKGTPLKELIWLVFAVLAFGIIPIIGGVSIYQVSTAPVTQETESYPERLWLVSTVLSLCIVLSALIDLAFYLGTSDQLSGGVLLLVTGLIPCSVVVINWCLVQKSKSWPIVTGEVIEADMKVKTSYAEGTTEKLWFPRIRYRYSVFDSTYVSNRIAFGGRLKYSNWGKARTLIRKYKVGDKVPVFYNPKKPKFAVLERKAAGEFYLMGRVVLIIFALGLLFLYPLRF